MKRYVSRPRTRVVAAILFILAVFAPSATHAASGQEKNTEDQRADVRARKGEVDLQVDLLKAQNNEIATALKTLDTNVATQAAQVEEAERASNAAQEDLSEAEDAVKAAEQRIDDLNAASNEFVVDAYIHPPTEDAFDALSADTISDATIKQAI